MSRFSLLVTRYGKVSRLEFATLAELAVSVYRFGWYSEQQFSYPPTPFNRFYDAQGPFTLEAFDGMSVLSIPQLNRHGANLGASRRPWYWGRLVQWPGYGPVPGTGRRFRYGRSWLRCPQTQHDRRESCRPLDVGEPKGRAKRNHHHLPSAWDDVSRDKPRSWKVHGKRRKAWDR